MANDNALKLHEQDSNEGGLPILRHEDPENNAQEPDLNNTSFFPDNELLEGKELSFSQKVEQVNVLLLRNTLNRPVLYRILTSLESEAIPYGELETRIQQMPGYEKATQPPGELIKWLDDVDALTIIEVDEEGKQLTEEDYEGKTEDEIDDMIFDFLAEITEQGKAAITSFNPEDLLFDLLHDKPQRYTTYITLLEFLQQKRAYIEIDKLLRGNPVLMDGRDPDARPMQPSVFVDKLSSAGAIVFEGGWIITPEGSRFLESAPKVLNA